MSFCSSICNLTNQTGIPAFPQYNKILIQIQWHHNDKKRMSVNFPEQQSEEFPLAVSASIEYFDAQNYQTF